MDVKPFAEQNRLKTRRDVDDSTIIQGKQGQIFEGYDTGELGLLFMPSALRARLWNSIKRECIAVGMILKQDGDAEGVLAFDGGNPEHARLAIKVMRARAKRQMSPEERSMAVERLARIRPKAGKEGTLATRNDADAKTGQQGTATSNGAGKAA